MTKTVNTGPVWSQEPRNQSRSPTRVAMIQVSEPPRAAAQVAQSQGTVMRSGGRTSPRRSNTGGERPSSISPAAPNACSNRGILWCFITFSLKLFYLWLAFLRCFITFTTILNCIIFLFSFHLVIDDMELLLIFVFWSYSQQYCCILYILFTFQ